MPYTVKSGDTLGQIAAALGVADWRTLYVNDSLAGDTDPTKLGIGAIIYTPEEGAGGTGGPANEDGSDSPAGQAGASPDTVTETATTVGAGAGTGVSAASGENTADAEAQGSTGVGGFGQDPGTALTILEAEQMVWGFDQRTGKWYVQYGLPNSNRWLVFEADPDQMDALFGAGRRPVAYEGMAGGLEGLLAREGRTFAGNVSEMAGSGSFDEAVTKVVSLALDDGLLPDWAQQDGAAMDIIYTAQVENKGFDWIVTQLSELPSFKTRFPNIEKLRADGNLSMVEAVTGFLEFEASTKKSMAAHGFGSEAVTPSVISGLIQRGYNAESVATGVATYKRMQDFAPALNAFNQVLASQGFNPIASEQEMFDFMSGNAAAEVYDVYEASSIQEAAQAAGLGEVFSAADAMNTALQTDQTLASANKGMQQAAQLLLSLRAEVDVSKFDLDHEELIDISLGQQVRSGRTQSQVQESINRAVLTAQGTLRRKAKPFTGFTQTGTPQAASLSNLRQTS